MQQPVDLTLAKTLPVKEWSAKAPKAVIVAVHGFNDYSHAFELPGKYFSEHDITIVAYDQRGFGANEPQGVWGARDNIVNDVYYQIEQVQQRYPDTPIYVLGESMGGAVALAAMADEDAPKIDGLILLSPAVWGSDTLPLLYRSSLWIAAHTLPWKTLTGSELKIRSTDNDAVLYDMAKDPLVIKGTRIDAIYGIVQLMDEAHDAVPKVDIPTLLLYGAKDEVIPKEPILLLKEHTKATLTYHYYTDGYHLLLRDLQRERVYKDIARWINDNQS